MCIILMRALSGDGRRKYVSLKDLFLFRCETASAPADKPRYDY
jgi:hypothetical protein